MAIRGTSTRRTPAVRCYTRALKNARHLQEVAPEDFATDPAAEGFGTGVPVDLLRRLHRIESASPILRRHPSVAAALRKRRPPTPGHAARDALFNGTIHFAQITFQTPSGNLVIPTADMNQILQYAQRAVVPICEYAAQYGPNAATISPTLLTSTVTLASASYTNADLKGWVNSLASTNNLPANSCIFVVSPQGLTSKEVGGNAGYHDKANVPFIVAGVFATGLTLADDPDVYAMVVSHEIAEMIVDPNVDGQNPEVCDACDLNCSGNLTRCYFDAADNFLGVNQGQAPGGFTFAYYVCGIVKPAGTSDCPASTANCAYAPVLQDCELVVDKSTFGADEVRVQFPGTASYPAAYWVALDGFTAAELGFQTAADLANPTPNPAPNVAVTLDPALNPSLTPAQLATIGANLPTVSQLGPLPVVATDPTLAPLTQRFLYPYTISLSSDAAFNALGLDQAAVLTLTSTISVGQVTRSASAALELAQGENPFLTNVNPSDPSQPVWLSFDLRFFKVAVTPGGSAARFAATMTSDPAAAPGFIASAIRNLTTGSGAAGGETFADLAQDEEAAALEFLQQDSSGRFVFNFAVARVRLIGATAGAQASNVRVFFRLFQAQTTNTSFDEASTYRFASDGVLNGHKIPLLGVQNDGSGTLEYVTIPCFASPRINLSAPAAMDGQFDPPNVQTIAVNPGVEVDTFFGCWLDINQPQQTFLPLTPPLGNTDGPWGGGTLGSINQAITRAPHQCLVAEIRYDDTPIPAGANAGTSDKLAQRNIAWVDGPNPGVAGSRQMPHPFEIRASARDATSPDELMIFWGDTPRGSSASIYLPAFGAGEIVSLADVLYGSHGLTVVDAHTIRVPAAGVTFVPIPSGPVRTTGLLSVELPPVIRKGEAYSIAVRQVTEGRFTPPPVIGRGRSRRRQALPGELIWREVAGAFDFAIVISTKEALLEREERLLAWLRFLFQTLRPASPWYPVWERYVELISGRVSGFGGDPATIQPSATGTLQHRPKPHPGKDHDILDETGKVVGLIHDRFGDFEGFILTTRRGRELTYRSREHATERLVRTAWAERALITVRSDRDDWETPFAIIIREAPAPFQH
jgi:hypothetical protein